MSVSQPAASGPFVGEGSFRFQAAPGWEQLPAGWSFGEAVGVATDSADNVFVFCRGEHPIIVFDRAGRFLRSWGEGATARPHGITIGPDDSVYLVDDFGHAVFKFTPEGRLLATFGTPGVGSDTGAIGLDYRTIQRVAGPFNCPTNVAIAADGDLYVADGYGNARVHHFSPDGQLLHSWGEPVQVPASFTCRTASRSIATGRSWCAIAKIIASSGFRQPASFSKSGPVSHGLAKPWSIPRETCSWPSWVTGPACTKGTSRRRARRPAGGSASLAPVANCCPVSAAATRPARRVTFSPRMT